MKSSALLVSLVSLVVCGCFEDPSRPEPAPRVPSGTPIGADGGTVVSKDGTVTLVIPEGALDEEVELSVKEIGATRASDALREMGAGRFWRLLPDGVVFETPITVRIETGTSAEEDDGLAGIAEVFVLESADGAIETVNGGVELSAEGGQVLTAEVSHFSTLATAAGDAGEARPYVDATLTYAPEMQVGDTQRLQVTITPSDVLAFSNYAVWTGDEELPGFLEGGRRTGSLDRTKLTYDVPVTCRAPDMGALRITAKVLGEKPPGDIPRQPLFGYANHSAPLKFAPQLPSLSQVTVTATAAITCRAKEAQNRPPLTRRDTVTATRGRTTTVPADKGVLANDSDPEGKPLKARIVETPEGFKTFEVEPDGALTVEPEAENPGTEATATYEACDEDDVCSLEDILVEIEDPQNRAPTAAADSYTTEQNTTLVVGAPGLLANDDDPDGDTLHPIDVSSPAHGAATLQPDGSFSYTPETNFVGEDSFTYKAHDGTVSSPIVTVTITVTAKVAGAGTACEALPASFAELEPGAVAAAVVCIDPDMSCRVTNDTAVATPAEPSQCSPDQDSARILVLDRSPPLVTAGGGRTMEWASNGVSYAGNETVPRLDTEEHVILRDASGDRTEVVLRLTASAFELSSIAPFTGERPPSGTTVDCAGAPYQLYSPLPEGSGGAELFGGFCDDIQTGACEVHSVPEEDRTTPSDPVDCRAGTYVLGFLHDTTGQPFIRAGYPYDSGYRITSASQGTLSAAVEGGVNDRVLSGFADGTNITLVIEESGADARSWQLVFLHTTSGYLILSLARL